MIMAKQDLDQFKKGKERSKTFVIDVADDRGFEKIKREFDAYYGVQTEAFDKIHKASYTKA